MNPQSAYVDAAISVMKIARTESDLLQWWEDERHNRQKWRLSPNQDPGLKLKEAFDLKRNELKGI